MKRFLTLIPAAALVLSLAACGGQPQASVPPEEPATPGTYQTVSLYQAPDYVFNDNGSYDHGEEKGTYTLEEDDTITLEAKDADQSQVLTPAGGCYYTEAAFTEDAEYGMAPTFDEEGHSNQSFEAEVGELTLQLILKEDGSFLYTTSAQSEVYPSGVDTVSYEGTYTLADQVLSLSWNGTDYPMILADEQLHYIVYQKQTDENSAAIQAAQAAVQEAQAAAASESWWGPVDETLAAEIDSQLQGTWEYTETGEYGLYYQLTISGGQIDVHIELLGYPAENSGTYTICSDVLLVHYEGGTQGYIVVPYTYEGGTLKLYPVNSLTDEGVDEPDMQFVTDEAKANGPWFTKTA